MKFPALFATCVLAFSVATTSVCAADAAAKPSARQLELAHRYIELIQIDKAYADAMKAMGPSILATMPKGEGSDPAFQAKILDAVSAATSDLMTIVVKKMEPIMAEIYTEEELSDLVDFYSSKSGRALMEKQPLMTSKMAPLMIDIMPQFQASLKEKICARVDCKALAEQK